MEDIEIDGREEDQDLNQADSGTSLKGAKQIIQVVRRHWIALDKGFVFIIALAITGGLGLKFGLRVDVLLFILFFWFALFFSQAVSWWFSVTILSNSGLEIITQSGMFKRSVVDIPFESIINTNYATKGLFQALLGFGTIVIQTQSGDIVLEKISKPASIHSLLTKNYNKFRGFEEDNEA